METAVNILVQFVLPIILFIGGWRMGGKSKANAETAVVSEEAKSKELDNVDKAVEIWRKAAEKVESARQIQEQEYKDKIESSRQIQEQECKEKMDVIIEQNKILIQQNEILKQDNEILKQDNLELKKNYNELKKLIK